MHQNKPNPPRFTLSLLFASLFLVASNVVYAANTDVTTCDTLASSPYDPNKVAEGVSFSEVNTALAEPACKEAVTNDPTNPRLQYEYGRVFDVKKDYASALVWYTKAADQNHAAAQYNLGVLYDSFGDRKKAFDWYQKAANQHFADAQNNLGVLYRSWPPVQDFNKAFEWFQKAANNGSDNGFLNLGVIYHNGQGVSKDEAKALANWRTANDHGVVEASIELIFSWAEAVYPSALPGFAYSLPDYLPPPYDNYNYRHYTAGGVNIYVAYNFDDKHLYYVGPATGNKVIDLGVIDPYLQQALAYEATINPQSH